MMRLLRIEWRRMWSRRLPWVLILIVAAAILLSGVMSFATHSPESPDVSDFEEQLTGEIESCRTFATDEWSRFNDGTNVETDPEYLEYLSRFPTAEAYADESCNPEYFGYYIEDKRFCLVSLYEPKVQYRRTCPDVGEADNPYVEQAESVEYEEGTITINGVDYKTVRPMANGIVPSTSLMLLALAAVIGASFIGAEYAAGTIETTLLWEPRRRRVLAAKLGVAGATAFLAHIFLLALLVAVMLPSAQWRGTTAGADSEFWLGLAGIIVRGGIAAAAVAAIALSISTMTRGTVGGVVALLGYIAISPTLAYTVLKGFRSYDLTENMTAFANGGEVGRFVRNDDGYLDSVFAHGGAGALLVIAIYVGLAILLATTVFSRRDID